VEPRAIVKARRNGRSRWWSVSFTIFAGPVA
jgi:hypothetical protein